MSNIVTFDGPAASGKGTAGQMMAKMLGFAYLDSGALYRALAYDCVQMGVYPDNKRLVGIRAHGLDIAFGSAGQIMLRGRDISQDIRTEKIGKFASVISAYQKVREELGQKQLDFGSGPGLVADGRDMGTEIFPDAIFKVFFSPPAHVRGQWRTDQLKKQDNEANYLQVTLALMARDGADRVRAVSPLRPAEDAYLFDNSMMTIELGVEHLHAMAIKKGIIPNK